MGTNAREEERKGRLTSGLNNWDNGVSCGQRVSEEDVPGA